MCTQRGGVRAQRCRHMQQGAAGASRAGGSGVCASLWMLPPRESVHGCIFFLGVLFTQWLRLARGDCAVWTRPLHTGFQWLGCIPGNCRKHLELFACIGSGSYNTTRLITSTGGACMYKPLVTRQPGYAGYAGCRLSIVFSIIEGYNLPTVK